MNNDRPLYFVRDSVSYSTYHDRSEEMDVRAAGITLDAPPSLDSMFRYVMLNACAVLVFGIFVKILLTGAGDA